MFKLFMSLNSSTHFILAPLESPKSAWHHQQTLDTYLSLQLFFWKYNFPIHFLQSKGQMKGQSKSTFVFAQDDFRWIGNGTDVGHTIHKYSDGSDFPGKLFPRFDLAICICSTLKSTLKFGLCIGKRLAW